MGKRGAETRRKIVEAALNVLRAEGAAGLTMRQVASRTGLALSNLQYHYPSREALLVGLVDHHLEACRGAMARGLEKASGDPLSQTLVVSLSDPDVLATTPVFRELFALATQDRGVRERLEAHFREMFDEAVAGLLASGTAVSRQRCVEVVSVLMAAIEGYYLLAEVTRVTGERMAELLLEIAVMMLRETEQ